MLATPLTQAASPIEGLDDLSLEELSALEVTSVSKAPELLQRAPAAIFVITHDDIVRSGVTSIAEALRLAPNLQVTQFSASRYVVGARGFAGAEEAQNFSNKLLILIDGRSVYSPLYSGVFLDVQDVLMDDIDRIEVISGPGATLWGANAMNGVINIITRPAYVTDTSMVSAGLGTDERIVRGRYAGRAGETLSYRVYGKLFRRDALDMANGASAGDDWYKAQGGFRTDWGGDDDSFTVQGDVYHGEEGQLNAPEVDIEGANLLGRWQRRGEASELQVQAWYDYNQRGQPSEGLSLLLHTVDVEVQQRIPGEIHRLVWGAGTRVHHYEIHNDLSQALTFSPSDNELWLGNLFVQDSIALGPRVDLTLGLKIERATYSGWSPLPDLRLAWRLGDNSLLWAAASRAIRSATPFDHDVVEMVPGIVLTGNPDFDTEKVNAFEIGYRGQPSARFSYSASVFYNDYDDLRTVEILPSADPNQLVLQWGNQMQGSTYGLEAWAKWQATSWWRLSPGVRLLRKDLEFKPAASGIIGLQQSGNDPEHQFLLTSSMDLTPELSFDATLRHMGALPDPRLEAYEELSATLNQRIGDHLDVSISGFNLLHDSHAEYPQRGEQIARSVIAQARWRF